MPYPTPSGLERTVWHYQETSGIFLMDDRLDSGECSTLADIAETLERLLDEHGEAEPDVAIAANRVLARVAVQCEERP